jgi:hypothetical protein
MGGEGRGGMESYSYSFVVLVLVAACLAVASAVARGSLSPARGAARFYSGRRADTNKGETGGFASRWAHLK